MDNYFFKAFNQLQTADLYGILRLRQVVFVIEQNCIYLDIDSKDQDSFHLFWRGNNEEIVAYARIMPRGVAYEKYIGIGRVVVRKDERAKGLGRKMMKVAVQKSKELFGDIKIKISAQSYLQSFYESLGFKYTGESYLEDEIPHIAMVY